MSESMPPAPDKNTASPGLPTRCEFRFSPDVRCQMEAGHDEPYYPYLDRGQWGEYSDVLSRGTPHQVRAAAPELPPRTEWTGDERRDAMRVSPTFRDDFPASGGGA